MDANQWGSSNDPNYVEDDIDWMSVLSTKPSWEQTTFKSIEEEESGDDDSSYDSSIDGITPPTEDGGEAWLDILQSISADEVEFMNRENERAEKLQQMQEMGYSKETIESTLNVAVDTTLEYADEEDEEGIFEKFQEETATTGFGMYVDDINKDDDFDLTTVESHTTVEIDEETGDPVRNEMIYVDEVSCIGCTYCATIAQSTFFMEEEQGRARVFQQWGDDDETIEIAIDTCPVDCIHYISYAELEQLEIERRDQNINNAGRLVNTGGESAVSRGNIGGKAYTGPQRITGDNPDFEVKEKGRMERERKRELKREMEKQNKSVEL